MQTLDMCKCLGWICDMLYLEIQINKSKILKSLKISLLQKGKYYYTLGLSWGIIDQIKLCN